MKKCLIYFLENVILYRQSKKGTWELSSAGRASALQAEGHRFEPCSSHHLLALLMREWLSGRASPCQGECREFESRFPLHFFLQVLTKTCMAP